MNVFIVALSRLMSCCFSIGRSIWIVKLHNCLFYLYSGGDIKKGAETFEAREVAMWLKRFGESHKKPHGYIRSDSSERKI